MKKKYSPAVRSKILSKLIFASCVCDTPIARITGSVLYTILCNCYSYPVINPQQQQQQQSVSCLGVLAIRRMQQIRK